LPEILEPDWTFALIDSSKFPSHRTSDLIGRLLCFDFSSDLIGRLLFQPVEPNFILIVSLFQPLLIFTVF